MEYPGEHVFDEASACRWTDCKYGWAERDVGRRFRRETSRVRGTYQYYAWVLTLSALNIFVPIVTFPKGQWTARCSRPIVLIESDEHRYSDLRCCG